MRRDAYTHYPRPILWLVRSGELSRGGSSERVAVSSFYLSKTPVTNLQFEAFDPSYDRRPSSPGDRDPAVGIAYVDAIAYASWYAGVSRKAIRLPTEIEWEYACRGDASGGHGGGTVVAAPEPAAGLDGFRPVGPERVPPLEQTRPNEFGLYGLLGGVWEWADPLPGHAPALFGGSFRTPVSELRCPLRRAADPRQRSDDVGFRIAKSFRR